MTGEATHHHGRVNVEVLTVALTDCCCFKPLPLRSCAPPTRLPRGTRGGQIKPTARREEIIAREVARTVARDDLTVADIETLEVAVLRAGQQNQTRNEAPKLAVDGYDDDPSRAPPVLGGMTMASGDGLGGGVGGSGHGDGGGDPGTSASFGTGGPLRTYTASGAIGEFAEGGVDPTIAPVKRVAVHPRYKASEEWVMLAEHDRRKWEEEEKAKKRRAEKMRESTHSDLWSQMTERHARDKAESEAERAAGRAMDEAAAKAIADEMAAREAKKAAELEAFRKQHQVLSKQIERRRAAEEAHAASERERARKMRQDVADAEEADRVKKLEAREAFKRFIYQNEAQLQFKREQLEREKEADVVRMKEYAKVMEAQEKAREAQFAKAAADQTRRANQFQQAVAEQLDEEAALERRIEEVWRERDAKAAADAQAVKDRRARSQAATNAFVAKQVEEKRAAKQRQRDSDKVYLDSVKERMRRADEAERRKEAKARERNLRHRRELEEQIREQHKVVDVALMSETERALNKALLVAASARLPNADPGVEAGPGGPMPGLSPDRPRAYTESDVYETVKDAGVTVM